MKTGFFGFAIAYCCCNPCIATVRIWTCRARAVRTSYWAIDDSSGGGARGSTAGLDILR